MEGDFLKAYLKEIKSEIHSALVRMLVIHSKDLSARYILLEDLDSYQ